eukprot:8179333-Karenia_brevis.AAC.1
MCIRDRLMATHGYECSISGRAAEELARSAHTPEQDVRGDDVEHDQNEAIPSDPQHDDTTFAYVPSSQTLYTVLRAVSTSHYVNGSELA